MNIRISIILDRLRSSLWFLPALMTAGAILLSFLAVRADQIFAESIPGVFGLMYTGGPDGAREILATTAGSMITVAGVSFSVVIVALSLASSQFGPRLLRNFMRDRGNQFVLGTFIATFIYCLLVLGTVRSEDEPEMFVPYIAVTVGILLAICSLAVLIYFIHHVSQSVQANHVVRVVAEDFEQSIRSIFPEQFGNPHGPQENGREQMEQLGSSPSWTLMPEESGYLKAIDDEQLMKICRRDNLVARIEVRPGDFVRKGVSIARIWPSAAHDEELERELNRSFSIGEERTTQQDLEFAIDQLVEVAVRALSTGVNDPFTAIACIDRLGKGMLRLLDRDFPSPYRYDTEGRLRIVARVFGFDSVTDAAFDLIRQHGSGTPSVILRLLDTIIVLLAHTRKEDRARILFRHAERIRRAGERSFEDPSDLEDLQERFGRVVDLMKEDRNHSERSS
jgi:uncharacterized membrane protein